MSPVVTSAMMFVKQLGEPFLWVDTLCIIQDSPDRQAYLSRVNELYKEQSVRLLQWKAKVQCLVYLKGSPNCKS